MREAHATKDGVDTVFRALADPTRRSLYERLAHEEDTVARLTAVAGVSQPAVSQHVAVLRAAGLLTERKNGRSTLYRADPKALAPLLDWIAAQDRFWRNALGRLDQILKEIEE
jgi:DNA-binding transcriptional ArsR family regulator